MTPPTSRPLPVLLSVLHGNHQYIQRVTIKMVDNLLFLFIGARYRRFPRMLLVKFVFLITLYSVDGKAMETTTKIVV
jgi:hypothetical protein